MRLEARLLGHKENVGNFIGDRYLNIENEVNELKNRIKREAIEQFIEGIRLIVCKHTKTKAKKDGGRRQNRKRNVTRAMPEAIEPEAIEPEVIEVSYTIKLDDDDSVEYDNEPGMKASVEDVNDLEIGEYDEDKNIVIFNGVEYEVNTKRSILTSSYSNICPDALVWVNSVTNERFKTNY